MSRRVGSVVAQQRRTIVLVSSSGGVLLDLLALEPWWSRHDARWVAVSAPDTRVMLVGKRVHWRPEHHASHPLRLVPAVVRAYRDLSGQRPDVLVSAGTGVAVPYFVAARLLGISLLWVETFNVVGRSGLAARLCACLADSVLVQRPELVPRRRRSVLVGELY